MKSSHGAEISGNAVAAPARGDPALKARLQRDMSGLTRIGRLPAFPPRVNSTSPVPQAVSTDRTS